jgi:hypothetical protein
MSGQRFANVLAAIAAASLGSAAIGQEHRLRLSEEFVLLPDVLRSQAIASKCEEIRPWPDDIGPPYVFGWQAGPKPDSAAFWCRVPYARGSGPAFLEQLIAVGKRSKCASALQVGSVAPLKVVRKENVRLNEFTYFHEPRGKGPSVTVPSARLLRIGHDDAGFLLYCHGGRWLSQFWH